MQIIGRRADVLRIRPEPNSRSLVVILADAVQEHLSVYMYILLYYLFTDKDSLQESHVYLTLLTDVEVISVSVYPEAQSFLITSHKKHIYCVWSLFLRHLYSRSLSRDLLRSKKDKF